MSGPRTREVALYALCFLVTGLVVLALGWSGTGPYEDLARANGATTSLWSDTGPQGDHGEVRLDLPALVDWHARWSAYVTGGTEDPPITWGRTLFTESEYAHMADVRRVFDVAKLVAPLGIVGMVLTLQAARRRSGADALRLARDGSFAAAAVVLVIGVGAALAFDQLFLLFHRVFFPQGNFLFGPDSNLIRLYPDWYWEGITYRVGASFVALAGAAAAVSALALHRAR